MAGICQVIHTGGPPSVSIWEGPVAFEGEEGRVMPEGCPTRSKKVILTILTKNRKKSLSHEERTHDHFHGHTPRQQHFAVKRDFLYLL